ncbi:MAG: hypothetical protein AMXMBFR64_42860 [Myxococcales bacterium]
MTVELPPPPVDLATLLGEMAALKAEVRAETRASRDIRDRLVVAQAALETEVERAGAREERLRADAQADRDEARRRAARALIAVLDRTEALRAAAASARPRGLWPFRRLDPAITALAEGLALNEARLAETLAGLGASRIKTAGQTLDPHRMEAVGTAEVPTLPDLAVVEELVSGWMDGDTVLRTAQVVVNRARPVAPSGEAAP